MKPGTRVALSEVSAVTTAGVVAASIFCCLPFATGILGAGLAALGARFEPFRPYLTAMSVVSLASVLYQTYGPTARRCSPDGCEVTRPSVARQVLVWSVVVGVALMLTASWWADRVIYWTL